MHLIPAVDIKNGKCVRLTQGKAELETVYADDPARMARQWNDAGAGWIHIVDLDGAFAGKPVNHELVKKIISGCSAAIEIGGGIRTLADVETYVNHGAARVILGTIALTDPQLVADACRRFPGKIAVGIDARDGLVAIKGWVEVSTQKASDLARQLQTLGVSCFIFTDISRDGMMQGPNLHSIREFAQSTQLPVIASGGVSRMEDIAQLLKLKPHGVAGAIIGKALYDKTIDYAAALRLVKDHAG